MASKCLIVVIIKPWSADIEMRKVMVDKVPIWVHFPDLDLKYRGKGALTKIVGLVGKPMKADNATIIKEKLINTRVLVKVSINHTQKRYYLKMKLEI